MIENDVDRQRRSDERNHVRELGEGDGSARAEHLRDRLEFLSILCRLSNQEIDVLGHHRRALKSGGGHSDDHTLESSRLQGLEQLNDERFVRGHKRPDEFGGERIGGRSPAVEAGFEG
jgi:hypothetical protein